MNYGTFAYGIAAGATGAIGLVFIMLGVRRHRPRRVAVCLGLFSLAAAANTVAHVQLQSSDDIAEYASVIQGPFAITGLLGILAMAWLVSAATDIGWPRAPLLFTAWAAALTVVNAQSAGGLIVEEVTALRPVSLFGEDFVLHEANSSSLRWLLNVFLLSFVVYAGFALAWNWRRGERRLGLLGPALGLLIVMSLFDSLIDEGIVNSAYLMPFFELVFTIVLALELASLVGRSERRLHEQSSHMEELVAIRTRSLHEANVRIADDLERQQRNAGRLARLTRQLVELNSVAVGPGGTGGLEQGLAGTISSVGEMVDAKAVDLEVDRSTASLDDLDLHWSASPPGGRSDRTHQRAWPLRVGPFTLGSLRLTTDADRTLTAEQEQLAALAAEYVATTVKRVELEEAQVESALDHERHRIARDLHDSVSQRLYAAAFQAEALTNRANGDANSYQDEADGVRSLVLGAMAEMRTLLFELQPETLAATRLTTLVEQLCASLGVIHHRKIEVATTLGPVVPAAPKLALYRIAQEAIGNAVRHSEAETISATVALTPEWVDLTVADDGVGFDPRSTSPGHGLRNIETRTRQIGASLVVDGVPGVGTTVTVRWDRDRAKASTEPTSVDLRRPLRQGADS